MNPQSVNAAPHIAALFAPGAAAYQTREDLSANALLPEEQQFVARAVPKRVREFAGGRACARAALAQLGLPAVALPVIADRVPQWPPGFTGSITHTDGFCAAVVAATSNMRSVGLDVEVADSVRPHLWHRICYGEELARVQSLEAQAALEAATLVFSAKEAFYKCQHFLTGQYLGFANVSVTFESEGFTVRPTRALQITQHSAGPWHGRFRHEPGLVITGLCIA